jgi:hypothetical protein
MHMKFLSVIILSLLLISGYSCNRKLIEQRRDEKSVNRVLSRVDLTEIVGREWEEKNPCINDTITVIDTVETVTKKDSVPPLVVPEEWNFSGETKDGIFVMMQDGKLTVTVPDDYNIKYVNKTHTVEDKRRLNIALDSVNYYKGVTQQKEGVIGELQKTIVQANQSIKVLKDERKSVSANLHYLWKSLMRKWWFWLIVVAIAAYFLRNFWIPKIPFLSNLLKFTKS